LAAFYRRETAPYFQLALSEGIRKIRQVLKAFPFSQREYSSSPSHFFNLNTPADLRLAKGRLANLNRRVPLISITAPASGTGKTTFIEKLLPRLKERGIRTGVIKSDSHGFNLDMEGKDSCRFSEAGAESVAVVSPQGWFMVQKTQNRAPFEDIAAKMEGVDLILTESRSHGTLPALTLWRGQGEPLTGNDAAALFTSSPHSEASNLYEYDLNDIEKAMELCLFLMGR
jgi:molybdopterin-guanine dinucleotide biosynthesis protein MobB